MVATLRMYQDPTYSIPASSTAAMPIVVSRFYLEVSTKFTRNRITISDCTSAHVENSLNASDALKPRLNYCDNSTFDTLPERSPNGVTHMDRLSMKKFKYQGTTDVFMQCKIRACAQQPCGVCTGSGDPRALQSVDLSPAEGEMFAPPVSVRVSARDQNALTFAAPTGAPMTQSISSRPSTAQNTPSAAPKTSKPIEVRSQLTLSSVSATWAVQNRAALTATLRNTLQLQPEEDLIINSVVAARQLSAGRKLQSGGVKIDFTVGLVNANRASVSESRLRMLASGSSTIVSQFVRQLDVELQARGEAPVALSPASLAFTVPQRISTLPQQAAAPAGNQQSSWVYNNQNQEAPAAAAKPSSDSSTMMILGAVLVCALIGVVAYQRGKANSTPQQSEGALPDVYTSKIAQLDSVHQMEFEGFEQTAQ